MENIEEAIVTGGRREGGRGRVGRDRGEGGDRSRWWPFEPKGGLGFYFWEGSKRGCDQKQSMT